MKKRLGDFVTRSTLVLLLLLGLLGVGGLVLFLVYRRWDTAATLVVGLIATGVVWWQGTLIKKQIQFQSFIELDREWNSPEMLKTRETAFNKATKKYDFYKLEG